MKMKNALTIAAAVSAALFAQGSFAQAASNPMSTPAGQQPLPVGKTGGMSTESSADVKAKTKADAKHGKMTPAGEAASGIGDATSTSGMKASGAKVKADTKASAKDGTLTPAGEAPTGGAKK